MRKGTGYIAAIVAGLIVVALPVIAQPKDDGYPAIVTEKTLYAKNDFRGKKAPKLEVEEWLTGKAPAMKGKVIFIDFWATWCGPCKALIPEMNEWAEKFKDDMVMIGISDEKSEVVSKFMEGTKMKYHVAIDTQKRTSKELGVQGIPHVMIITPDGIVRWQGFPGEKADKLTEEKLKQIIDTAKASK
ncbi:MAG: TlpA family protein disulfide reductase [Fimbriimonadaceae bacterium]|nr:TlpA family protein disulfide reductase [Fimbriimonadaceae bacterium]